MKPCSGFFVCGAIALALLTSIHQTTTAQAIPNGGFESWTNGNPDGWKTTNTLPLIASVTQVSDAHSGSSAMQCSVVDYLGTPIPLVVLSGSNGQGIAVNTRPGALHGWFKFAPVGGDEASINAVFSKGNPRQAVAGTLDPTLSTSANVFTEFVKNIFYITGDVPDTATITITTTTGSGGYHVGTTLILDDLSWGPSTEVKDVASAEPSTFGLEQNYPNPFNPSTNIVFEVAKRSPVSLRVFDVLGREVATLVNEEMGPGRYRATLDGSSMASGTYIYRLSAGTVTLTKKLTLLK